MDHVNQCDHYVNQFYIYFPFILVDQGQADRVVAVDVNVLELVSEIYRRGGVRIVFWDDEIALVVAAFQR